MLTGVIQIIGGALLGLLWMAYTALIMTDFTVPLLLVVWLALLGLAILLIVRGIKRLKARADAVAENARQNAA